MSIPGAKTTRWSTWKAIATTFCVAALFGAYWICPLVRFTQEAIYITVHPEDIEVTGYYIYENPFPFPVVQGFSIPFPIDDEHAHPLGVCAHRMGATEREIPIVDLLGTPRFDLRFAPKEHILVRVRYCQYTPAHDARYILTTTQPWGRPIAKATYRLRPEGVTIATSNYPLERRCEDALGFERSEFMPEADWVFAWEVS